MTYSKTLILSRYHDDIANPIYKAYIKGIESQCPNLYFIDYFDQIGALGKRGFEHQVEALLRKEKIELVFIIFVSGDPILDPYFIQSIAQNRFMAMVFWDTEQFFEQIDRYYAQCADLVILPANYEYISKLQALNINAICPFSLFDSTKYKPDPHAQKSIDVSFVGEVTKGKRQEYLAYLEENGINIQTYGKGTQNGKVSFEKVVEIFNTSKINLSFTGAYANDVYSFCANINNRILQNKGKPIEIALCGGFVLTEYVPGIEKVFEPNSIDTFKSKEEFLEKIHYYLQHNEKREEMAQKAYAYACTHYDSVAAFQKIFQTIASITPKHEKPLILDPIFIKIHSTFHLFYAISFLMRKRFALAWDELKLVLHSKKIIFQDVKKFIAYEINALKQRKKVRAYCNALCEELGNAPVVIYGAGVHTTSLFQAIPNFKHLNIKAIADKNSSLWGKSTHGIPIIAPEEITPYAKHVIVSSFAFEKEIAQELKTMYPETLHIHTIYNQNFSIGLIPNDYQLMDPYQTFRNTLILR